MSRSSCLKKKTKKNFCRPYRRTFEKKGHWQGTIDGSVLQWRMKMDRRQIRKFWKFTEDEYKESSLIQKVFEDLLSFQILWIFSKILRFSKENGKILLLKIVLQTATPSSGTLHFVFVLRRVHKGWWSKFLLIENTVLL